MDSRVEILASIWERLNPDLRNKTDKSLSNADKAFIRTYYTDFTGKVFTNTSCGECYKDALFEMYYNYKKCGVMKENTSFKLLRGVTLRNAKVPI